MSRARRRATAATQTRIAAATLAVACVAAACDSGGDAGLVASSDVVSTVALGELPPALAAATPSSPPDPTTTTTTTTVPPVTELTSPLGAVVDGNRLLIIGDGVLATIASSTGGRACEVLVDEFGWQVGIAAAPGREIGFANRVLDAWLDPPADSAASGAPGPAGPIGTPTASTDPGGDDGDDDGDDDDGSDLDWDVAVVMLGNIFDGDLDAFEAELDTMIERLSPRPIVLFTLTEVGNEAEVNVALRRRAALRNVLVVDWAELSAAESGDLLRNGGPLPTTEGRSRIVELIAAEVGNAPIATTGDCLPSLLSGVGS